MNSWRMGGIVALLLVSACESSKGPPPRVAEVPIDDGTPRASVPVDPGSPGNTVTTSPPAAMQGLGATGDMGAAFGAAAAALGGGATGGGSGGGAAGLLGGGGGMPLPLPAMPHMTDVPTAGSAGGAGAAATGSSKPVPPKAERLSASDCNKLMDKYIALVGISQGISPDAISGVMQMLRNSVANDPNYANALGACAKENTKTQYRCAMKASDVDGWKKCLE